MELLEWKDEYSVGDDSIDHEHQQMIQQINALYVQLGESTDVEKITAVLGEIHADISAHFALEERLMRSANYAEYEAHKDDHEDLLDQILDLMDSLYKDPTAGRELLKTQLSNWFGRHFSSFDARLHRQIG